MSAQRAALAVQRAILRRAAEDGLAFPPAPPRSARMALHESRWVDALREMGQMARRRDPATRSRLDDLPLGLCGTPRPEAPEPLP